MVHIWGLQAKLQMVHWNGMGRPCSIGQCNGASYRYLSPAGIPSVVCIAICFLGQDIWRTLSIGFVNSVASPTSSLKALHKCSLPCIFQHVSKGLLTPNSSKATSECKEALQTHTEKHKHHGLAAERRGKTTLCSCTPHWWQNSPYLQIFRFFLAGHTGIFSDLEASCREGINGIIQAPSPPQAGTGVISLGARPGLIRRHIIQGQSMPQVISPAGDSPSPSVPAARSSN